jgi:flagellar hook assembly protein FlgD
MVQRHARYVAAGLVAALATIFAITLAFAAGTIQIVTISPSTFNPSARQSTIITYAVPATGNYRVYVRNSAGTTVRSLASYSGLTAGTRSTYWNGRDSRYAVVPSGTYTVVVDGTVNGVAQTPATAPVTVTSGSISYTGTAFAVTSVSPATFDPRAGQRASINYTVPTQANYRFAIKNSSGTQVFALDYRNEPPGPRTYSWNGTGTGGVQLANGTYGIVISGTTVTGGTLGTGTGTVTLGTGSTTPAPTGAFGMTSISPSTFDASAKATTTITYTVPTTANYHLAIKNSAGTEVRGQDYTNATAGTKTYTWNGTNSAGTVQPDGAYAVVITGSTTNGSAITSANGTVTIKTASSGGTTPPPPPTTGAEKGQLIEGVASGNFELTRYANVKFGIAFQSPRTGTVTQITLQWKKTTPYYGSGTFGIYTFEIHTNGADNYPSGNVIARATGIRPSQQMDGYVDGALHFSISANLTAGQKYHLVLYNTDTNPSANWSSPNSVMTRVVPWDATSNRGEQFDSPWGIAGKWAPYAAIPENPWATKFTDNGSHFPTMLTWSDGVNTGDPYYGALQVGEFGVGISGAKKMGQLMVWKGATTTVSRIGIPVAKSGTVSGNLMYHFEKVGSGDMASGVFATPSQVSGRPQSWIYVTLPQPVTLQTGSTYRLWFESPNTSGGYYYQNPVYGETRPMSWIEAGWGGSASYYQYSSGSSWSGWNGSDMSFSLQ